MEVTIKSNIFNKNSAAIRLWNCEGLIKENWFISCQCAIVIVVYVKRDAIDVSTRLIDNKFEDTCGNIVFESTTRF